jgi:hypothetical protein
MIIGLPRLAGAHEFFHSVFQCRLNVPVLGAADRRGELHTACDYEEWPIVNETWYWCRNGCVD